MTLGGQGKIEFLQAKTWSRGRWFAGAVLVLACASLSWGVPRDIVIHRDGTKVEGHIVEETAEKIILHTEKYGDLHFRKIDLAKVERGVDPDAQSTTPTQTPPSYDYRVYIPRGPIDPERPATPIVIAELIRRGLTPPPATIATQLVGAAPTAPPAAPTVVASPTALPPVVPSPQPMSTPGELAPRSPTPSPVSPPTPGAEPTEPREVSSRAPAGRPAPAVSPSVGSPIVATAPPPPISSPAVTPLEAASQLPPGILPVPTASSADYLAPSQTVPAAPAPSLTPPPPQTELAPPCLLSVRGSVELVRGNAASRRVTSGEALHTGDRLLTDREAVAVVRLAGPLHLLLGPASEITLVNIPGSGSTELVLSRGYLWIACSEQPPVTKFAIEVGTAHIEPDPNAGAGGIAAKLALLEGQRLYLGSVRGKLVVSDRRAGVVHILAPGVPTFYDLPAAKLEMKPELARTLEGEWQDISPQLFPDRTR